MTTAFMLEHRLSTLSMNQRIPFLLQALREHDFHTYIHSVNTAVLFLQFAKHLHISSEVRNGLINSILLHDIGKLYISSAILEKETKLTTEEWSELMNHPLYGEVLIKKFLDDCGVDATFASLHHENIDGSGYPYKYTDDQLPLFCKMLRIVDSYEAMTSDRPYSKALTSEEAFKELTALAGTCYDRNLVDRFIHMVKKEQLDPSI